MLRMVNGSRGMFCKAWLLSSEEEQFLSLTIPQRQDKQDKSKLQEERKGSYKGNGYRMALDMSLNWFYNSW